MTSDIYDKLDNILIGKTSTMNNHNIAILIGVITFSCLASCGFVNSDKGRPIQ